MCVYIVKICIHICMYVFVCLWVCICVGVCASVWIYTYIICERVYLCFSSVHVCAYLHFCVSVYLCACMCMWVDVIYACKCVFVHLCACVCESVCLCVYKCSSMSVFILCEYVRILWCMGAVCKQALSQCLSVCMRVCRHKFTKYECGVKRPPYRSWFPYFNHGFQEANSVHQVWKQAFIHWDYMMTWQLLLDE